MNVGCFAHHKPRNIRDTSLYIYINSTRVCSNRRIYTYFPESPQPSVWLAIRSRFIQHFVSTQKGSLEDIFVPKWHITVLVSESGGVG